MKYPQAADYHQAIQSPATVFRDPTLRAAQVKTDPLGMPMVSSGGFALTYYLDVPGRAQWVVRCFKVDVPDRQSRYAAISHFLNTHRHPIFTTVEYIQDGILVNGQRFPVVKMPFVRGETLHRYIERNLGARRLLAALPDQFRQLVNTLDGLGVAHGDLQHGNIIVDGGRLVLVDYDGMYVPALQGHRSTEAGHRSYQHPARAEVAGAGHFGAELDRFSAIVIYLALTAVAQSPNLWQKYSNGDNLLFVGQDFRVPENSRLLADLDALPALRSPAAGLRVLCRSELAGVPRLEDFLAGGIPSTDQGRSQESGTVPGRAAGAISQSAGDPSADASPALDAGNRAQLLHHLGDRVWVVGQITQLRKATTVFGDPYLFLNFGEYRDGCMTLVIWGDGLKLFGAGGVQPERYLGQWVSVRGLLTAYDVQGGPKQPQIVVELPSQIEVLPGGAAAAAKLLATSATGEMPAAEVQPQAAPAALELAVSVLDFGEVELGQEASTKLTLTNTGHESLEVEAISLRPWLKISPSRVSCEPGATRSAVVTLYTQGIPAALLQPDVAAVTPGMAAQSRGRTRYRLQDERVFLSAQQTVTSVEIRARLVGQMKPAGRPAAMTRRVARDRMPLEWRRALLGISVGVAAMLVTLLALILLLGL